jgi:carbon storage regulator
MLVLRRKAGEAIVLNGVITIHVLAVEGERVKLGISAPPEVVIVRSELLENQEQLASAPVTVPASASQPPRTYQEGDGGQNGQAIIPPPVEDVSLRPMHGRYGAYAGGPRPATRRRPAETAPATSHPVRYR